MIKKFPRTPHIVGSRHQVDDDMIDICFDNLKDKNLVVSEKIDGSNCGISFRQGKMQLQSRGHYLTGGYQERHWDWFKFWTNSHLNDLYEILGEQYIMYGEYMFCKHTEFYDSLPHYFIEFDIFDKYSEQFLSLSRRKQILDCSGIASVPVLYEGFIQSFENLTNLIGVSKYKSDNWHIGLSSACKSAGHVMAGAEIEMSQLAEGLYVKIEDDNSVISRCKFVRSSFTAQVSNSETHWKNRIIVKNLLADNAQIW